MKNIDKMPVDKYLKLMMEIELYIDLYFNL